MHTAGTAEASQISTTASRVRTRQWRSLTVPPSSRTTRVPVTMRPRLLPLLSSSVSKGMTTIQARITREMIALMKARLSPNSDLSLIARIITTNRDIAPPTE